MTRVLNILHGDVLAVAPKHLHCCQWSAVQMISEKPHSIYFKAGSYGSRSYELFALLFYMKFPSGTASYAVIPY